MSVTPFFTPTFEVVVKDLGSTSALVYGYVWRMCQARDGKCWASLQTIGEAVGVSRRTVHTHIKALCKQGYIIDTTPDRTHRTHEYVITDKLEKRAAEVCNSFTPQCETAAHRYEAAAHKETTEETKEKTTTAAITHSNGDNGQGSTDVVVFTPNGGEASTSTEAVDALIGIGVKVGTATAWAAKYGAARVLEVVEASAGTLNPPGWARRALEEGWDVSTSEPEPENTWEKLGIRYVGDEPRQAQNGKTKTKPEDTWEKLGFEYVS
jgi:biotin operon repressor